MTRYFDFARGRSRILGFAPEDPPEPDDDGNVYCYKCGHYIDYCTCSDEDQEE